MLLVSAWGCSDGVVKSPPAAAYRATDSVGVRLVVSNEPLWASGEGWGLSLEPLLTLGALDTPLVQQFHEIRGATRLGDGTVVALDGGSGELRAFDRSGRHRWTAGGRGDGPGEIHRQQDHRPFLHRHTGDTLEVDNGWDRLRFGPRGELLDHSRLGIARLKELGNHHVGRCAQGRSYFMELILICQTDNHPPQPGGRRWTTSYETVTQIPRTLDRVDTLGTFFLSQRWEARLPPPYPSGLTALLPSPLGPAGKLWVGGRERPKLLYARNDAYRIEVWDLLDATLQMVVRRHAPRRARTEAEVFARIRHGPILEPLRSQVSLTDDRWSVADSLSIAESFFLDDLGFLWVRRLPADDDEGRRWDVPARPGSDAPSGHVVWLSSGLHDVFRPDGAYLGTVKLPHELEVTEVGEDYVLGVTRDEMGVEYIRLYRLERGGPVR